MQITAFDLAQRYVGITEIAGSKNHPLIVWWLSLCHLKDQPDETPWCSAFVNGIAWELNLPRSKSAAARSWLRVGTPVTRLEDAKVGFDVVILKRGKAPQPDATVFRAPGHVGFYGGHEGAFVMLLGGNQKDAVGLGHFPVDDILGIRRLA